MSDYVNRAMVAAVLCLGVACSSSEGGPASREPLSGTVHGVAFEVAAATATDIDGARFVTLSSAAADCTTGTSPRPGMVVVNLTVPTEALVPGAHALGASEPAPRVAVTTFEQNADGSLRQRSDLVTSGTLHVFESQSGGLQGSLQIQNGEASLLGAFAADACAN